MNYNLKEKVKISEALYPVPKLYMKKSSTRLQSLCDALTVFGEEYHTNSILFFASVNSFRD
ncbi:hypothetical protein [Aquirufa nivalisilvae]|uniref:hypothetical protein n=1 Tax=Aquirufa nivalisilvae TaxID=2516557 RepID=UPI0013794BFC|nr:hypothetical protein [Aquirufa nivalisilvae]